MSMKRLGSIMPGKAILAAVAWATILLSLHGRAQTQSTVELRPPAPDGDVALLASASAARAFAATGARVPVVVIGPQTEAEARARGLEVVAVAASYDLDGLLDAVASL